MHFNSDYHVWAKNVSNGPVGEGLLLLLLKPESPPNHSWAESPTQHIAVTAGICITKAMYRPLTALWKCGGGRKALVNTCGEIDLCRPNLSLTPYHLILQ